MRFNRTICVVFGLAMTAVGSTCLAQEVGSVDLTEVKPRLDLRGPPLLASVNGVVRGVEQVHGCFGSTGNVGALRTTLVSLDHTEYQIGDEPKFEVRVENAGSAPLKLPVSPHLADLQPADRGQKFTYSNLDVVLWIGGAKWSANTGGTVALYGADDYPDTMLTLHPGEWVRIIGKGNIDLPKDHRNVLTLIHQGDAVDHANAKVSLYNTETLLAPEGGATVSREVCLAQTQDRSLPITVTEGESIPVGEKSPSH